MGQNKSTEKSNFFKNLSQIFRQKKSSKNFVKKNRQKICQKNSSKIRQKFVKKIRQKIRQKNSSKQFVKNTYRHTKYIP